MKIALVLLLIFLSACTGPRPKNDWQYQATAALDDYSKHYLQNRLLRAKADLSRAREFASRTANLHTLIDIELTVCALDIATLHNSSCQPAKELLRLQEDAKQQAYLHLLTKTLREEEVTLLPQKYQSFARALLNKEAMASQLPKIKNIRSRLVASALIAQSLTTEEIQTLVTRLSYRGYKKAVIAWLKLQHDKERDPNKQKLIEAKLQILTSN